MRLKTLRTGRIVFAALTLAGFVMTLSEWGGATVQADATNAPPAFDLNGIWESSNGASGKGDNPVERIKMYQIRTAILAIDLGGRPFVHPGTIFLSVRAEAGTTLPAQMAANVHAQSNTDPARLEWRRTTVSVLDSSHFSIGEERAFRRISSTRFEEIPCDVANPLHVSGEDADLRSSVHYALGDLATAACWSHVGALAGNAAAEADWAYDLYHGRGVQQDVNEALAWARKGAGQHEPHAESLLAEMVKKRGKGERAQELLSRYWQHDPEQVYLGDESPAMPTFLRDAALSYDLNGEWAVEFPASAPRHPQLTVVVLAKNGNFQLIVGTPNSLYAMGDSMFNGHSKEGRIRGKLLTPSASGAGDLTWLPAEIQIVDANNLALPGEIKLKRSSGSLGANRICDPVADAKADAGRTLIFADKSYELHNLANAACWYYVSASQGNAEAQLDLGLTLLFGAGVKQDSRLSFLWFFEAAKQGDVKAERAVAHCYQQGIGVKQDATQARLWTTKIQAQLRQARQTEAERQRMERNLAFLGGFLTGFKSDHDLRVDSYRAGGLSAREAQDRASADEAEASFFDSLMHGDLAYQPPPIPPDQ